MAKVIEGLYYSESHEFVRVEGDFGFVGITDYAQNALGNVVYVDMPDVDDEVEAGEEFGAVESVKAASDLISPVSGTVVEVNEALDDQPELINQDAFENWIIKVQLSDPSEVENLMDAKAYAAFCEKQLLGTCQKYTIYGLQILSAYKRRLAGDDGEGGGDRLGWSVCPDTRCHPL